MKRICLYGSNLLCFTCLTTSLSKRADFLCSHNNAASQSNFSSVLNHFNHYKQNIHFKKALFYIQITKMTQYHLSVFQEIIFESNSSRFYFH